MVVDLLTSLFIIVCLNVSSKAGVTKAFLNIFPVSLVDLVAPLQLVASVGVNIDVLLSMFRRGNEIKGLLNIINLLY